MHMEILNPGKGSKKKKNGQDIDHGQAPNGIGAKCSKAKISSVNPTRPN